MRIERHLPIAAAGHSAIDVLAESVPQLSRQKIKTAMNRGAVWLTHGTTTRRIRRATRLLPCGDTLHLYYDDEILNRRPPEPTLLADEQQYSVWYKPGGMLAQGSKWGDHCTITRWAEQHLTPQRPAFVVHRLDRAASGLMLIAHSKQAAAEMSALFRQRRIDKQYRVIVRGHFPAQNQARVLDQPLDGRPARSEAMLLAYDPAADLSLLDVRIDSGRKHQIRRHLAASGYPVAGDRLYGNNDQSMDLQLTAMSLSFMCPFRHAEKSYRLADELLPALAGVTPPRRQFEAET